MLSSDWVRHVTVLPGKHATLDLVKRLPGGDGMDGITDITITGVVSAVSEIVQDSHENSRIFRDYDGKCPTIVCITVLFRCYSRLIHVSFTC